MKNHNNLTDEQKQVLGFIHALNKNIESEIFNFEHSTCKDYEKLSFQITYLVKRRREYEEQAQALEIPEENVNAFNKGLIKGLINPNRLSYTAYY